MNIRPKSILLFSIVYILAPVFVIIQGALVNLVPLYGPANIFTRLTTTDILVLAAYPVCAVCIFSVRKWGWWAFIGFSLFLISMNVYVYLINRFTTVYLMFIFNVLITLSAGFFFRKHVIAPYFNPRLRIWEQSKRYELRTEVDINGKNIWAQLGDVSEGGCFIRSNYKLKLNAEYKIRILYQDSSIFLNARIVRSTRLPEKYYGYGLMFNSINETEAMGINQMLQTMKKAGLITESPLQEGEKREFVRFQADLSSAIDFEGRKLPVSLKNISTTGCCIESPSELNTGDICTLSCGTSTQYFLGKCEVVWKKKRSGHWLYGVSFCNPDRAGRKILKKIVKTIQLLNGKKRQWEKKQIDEVVESTLPHTPYKVFLALKGSFRTK